jgi:hypothetical protein
MHACTPIDHRPFGAQVNPRGNPLAVQERQT